LRRKNASTTRAKYGGTRRPFEPRQSGFAIGIDEIAANRKYWWQKYMTINIAHIFVLIFTMNNACLVLLENVHEY
jgi:hypothetical protein